LTLKEAPDELYSVLEAFRPFLKSIDMRTIAVRSPANGEWENLVTSIIASEKTVDKVKCLHDKLPKIRNNQILLFLVAVPFDYSVFEGFCQGEIGHGNVLVSSGGVGFGRLRIRTKQFDPLKLKVMSRHRRVEGSLKYALTATNSNSNPEREGLWAVAQNQAILTKQLGYASAEDLIRNTLRLEDVSHNKDFELVISDIAQVSGIIFNKSTFDVEISKISGLRNLQLNVIQSRTDNYGSYYPIWRGSILIDVRDETSKEQMYVVKEPIQPPDLLPFDHLDFELIHRDSALTLDATWRKVPLQNVVEPFFKALDAFCPLAEFKEMLLEPEKCGGKDPEKRFENAVAWLLSLAGFHTIYLGAKIKVSEKNNLVSYDVLRNESGIPIGCSDIIAYEENERLLLVDCDIGAPDEKKIHELIETRRYFENISKDGKLRILPVLCSPKNYGEAAKGLPITIVDKSILESMLEEIAKGYRESARSKITI